jgi:hypothetical protein
MYFAVLEAVWSLKRPGEVHGSRLCSEPSIGTSEMYLLSTEDIVRICRQAMCRCVLGTPSTVAQQPGEYQKHAAMTNQMWQQQRQLFAQPQHLPVDIALPRLMRQTVPELDPLPPPGGE